METYVRGFSYMPTNKVELVDIQDALERTWRKTRRERLKQREQKIWEEFVKENDIVSSICQDDQYQFLDELPESCVQDILESEIMNIKTAKEPVIEHKVQEVVIQDEQTVVHSLENDKDECDMFHIFDDEKDEQSAAEDGVLNESCNSPPATVRERNEPSPASDGNLERPSSEANTLSTNKSSENFTNVIESSIYCAKVKDLRIKINDEVVDMVSLLDRRQIFSMEKEDIARMIKRSAEFCARFNRIYLYQLQRQMQDIKRNNSLTLPFAKHTQFQSQMVRILSLHQNLLQSFQVFRKSVEQTCCVRDSVSALGALVGAARSATEQCAAVTHPKDLLAAHQLYDDNLLSSCDKLEQFVNEYAVRCEEFLMGYANIGSGRSKKSKEAKKTKKRPLLTMRNNSKNNSEADARLSMYSLNTVRLNTRSSTKDMQNSANKSRCTTEDGNSTTKSKDAGKGEPKSPKSPKSPNKRRKSPRSRRPLMRDPNAGAPRAPRAQRALRDDIPTMVEGVLACASTHMLNEDPTPAAPPRRTKGANREEAARKSLPNTPRKHRSMNPKPTTLIKGLIQTVTQEPNLSRHSPTLKARINKNSNKDEKKNQEEKREKKTQGKIQDTDKDKNNTTDENNIQFESTNLDSGTSEAANTKSHTTSLLNLEPIKSVSVRPASVKQETDRGISPVEKPSTEVINQIWMKDVESPRSETPKSPQPKSPRPQIDGEEKKVKSKRSSRSPDQCEVTRLLHQLCNGDTSGARSERTTGAKNAQLLFVNGNSPRSQPSTPQLLRILEETIQKKVPKSLLKKSGTRDVEKYRLSFNIGPTVSDNMFQYRTKFVQHMLTSPMYANSAVGKPWEMIGSVSEQIIDELLMGVVKDMQLNDYIFSLFQQETT